MKITKKEILRTEIAIYNEICDSEDQEDCLIYRNRDFPEFMDGQHLIVLDRKNRSFDFWINKFEYEISKKEGDIVNITFTDITPENQFINLNKNLWELDRQSFMFLTIPKSNPNPHQDDIERITDENFDLFRNLDFEVNGQIDWFKNEGFSKKKEITRKLNIEWYASMDSTRTSLLSSAGFFIIGNIARLQDVETLEEYRNQGYASAIIKKIIHCISRKPGVKGLALLVSNDNSDAYSLYERLGFIKQFEIMNLKRFKDEVI